MEADLRLKAASAVVLTGSSGSGKTFLAEHIVCDNKNIFTKPFSEVVWAHGRHAANSEVFSRVRSSLEQQGVSVRFQEGFPAEEIENNTLFKTSSKSHRALIVDDLFSSPTPNKTLQECFSVLSHHQNITVILMVQNLQAVSPGQRSALGTLLRSCSYLVVFVG